MTFGFDEREEEVDVSSIEGLAEELENQAGLLVAVATGGPRIQTVDGEYKRRRRRLIAALERRGLKYPFPWPDLWQWYGHWTSSLPGYASRRAHIRELVSPVLDDLSRQQSGLAVVDPKGSGITSWADLDARVAGLADELARAATPPTTTRTSAAGHVRSSSTAPGCSQTRASFPPARPSRRLATPRHGSISSSPPTPPGRAVRSCAVSYVPPGTSHRR